MISLVLTAVGPDRPGLVSAMADVAIAHGANWADSRMAHLAGQFAGIAHLQVPQERAEALVAALRRLDAIGLRVDVVQGTPGAAAGRSVVLELVGQDRPGIVREIARTLAARSISIDELDTRLESGSFSGEALFRAQARLRVSDRVPTAELRASLEALANDLMVDVTLDEADGTPAPPRG